MADQTRSSFVNYVFLNGDCYSLLRSPSFFLLPNHLIPLLRELAPCLANGVRLVVLLRVNYLFVWDPPDVPINNAIKFVFFFPFYFTKRKKIKNKLDLVPKKKATLP